MSGLFHIGDTEPSSIPTDLVLTNDQLLQAVDFAKMAFERLKGYSIQVLPNDLIDSKHVPHASFLSMKISVFSFMLCTVQTRECDFKITDSRIEQ